MCLLEKKEKGEEMYYLINQSLLQCIGVETVNQVVVWNGGFDLLESVHEPSSLDGARLCWVILCRIQRTVAVGFEVVAVFLGLSGAVEVEARRGVDGQRRVKALELPVLPQEHRTRRHLRRKREVAQRRSLALELPLDARERGSLCPRSRGLVGSTLAGVQLSDGEELVLQVGHALRVLCRHVRLLEHFVRLSGSVLFGIFAFCGCGSCRSCSSCSSRS